MTIRAMSTRIASHALITSIIITTIVDGTIMGIDIIGTVIDITIMGIDITIMVMDDRRIDLNNLRRRVGTL
jgi:hypothetical protein